MNGRKILQVFLAFFSYIPQWCCTEMDLFILDILSVITLSIIFPTATDKIISPQISECCILSYATGKIMLNISILETL